MEKEKKKISFFLTPTLLVHICLCLCLLRQPACEPRRPDDPSASAELAEEGTPMKGAERKGVHERFISETSSKQQTNG